MRRVAWVVEERVVWAGADAARSAATDFRWPFERLVWMLQRCLIWPLEDAFASRGRPARRALALVLVGSAAAAGVAGAQLGSPAGSSTPASAERLTQSAASVALVEPSSEPKILNGGQLQGDAPRFVPEAESASSSSATDAASTEGVAGAASGAPAPIQVNVVTEPVPPVALSTARRFADAFVLYEIGAADAEVLRAFRETATPALARALAERPPRQPAATEVPEARVLNVVAGPRYGRTASVSVALLRLGDTSELRLQLQRVDAGWRVDDVRG
jgi:hypothetical protein